PAHTWSPSARSRCSPSPTASATTGGAMSLSASPGPVPPWQRPHSALVTPPLLDHLPLPIFPPLNYHPLVYTRNPCRNSNTSNPLHRRTRRNPPLPVHLQPPPAAKRLVVRTGRKRPPGHPPHRPQYSATLCSTISRIRHGSSSSLS